VTQGAIDELRATLNLLQEQGLLDRVQSVGPNGVSFYPTPPKVIEMSQAELGALMDRNKESLETWERRIVNGAAGRIAPRKAGA
jgi:hypothetical protein